MFPQRTLSWALARSAVACSLNDSRLSSVDFLGLKSRRIRMYRSVYTVRWARAPAMLHRNAKEAIVFLKNTHPIKNKRNTK
jgi:hypothetical protein